MKWIENNYVFINIGKYIISKSAKGKYSGIFETIVSKKEIR